MTTWEFMAVLTEVVQNLPWMKVWNERPGHPEDISVSVSMAVDTVSETIKAMQLHGHLRSSGSL